MKDELEEHKGRNLQLENDLDQLRGANSAKEQADMILDGLKQ